LILFSLLLHRLIILQAVAPHQDGFAKRIYSQMFFLQAVHRFCGFCRGFVYTLLLEIVECLRVLLLSFWIVGYIMGYSHHLSRFLVLE